MQYSTNLRSKWSAVFLRRALLTWLGRRVWLLPNLALDRKLALAERATSVANTLKHILSLCFVMALGFAAGIIAVVDENKFVGLSPSASNTLLRDPHLSNPIMVFGYLLLLVCLAELLFMIWRDVLERADDLLSGRGAGWNN